MVTSHAYFLISQKRTREWESEIQRVLELDPLNPFYQCFYGWHLVYLGNCFDAIAYLRESRAADLGFSSAHVGLWGSFYKSGRLEDAQVEARKFFAAMSDQEVEEAMKCGYELGGYSEAMRLGAEILANRAEHCHVPSVRKPQICR